MKKLLSNELISYLFFGVLTTLVYLIVRLALFPIMQDPVITAGIANVTAVIFAFFTNDTFVFKQKRSGKAERFIKFILARLGSFVTDLLLAHLLVERFPQIIGQFVGNDPNQINAYATYLGQIIMTVLNYVVSKLFVFKKQK